jgi:uncharacterized protein (DUF885 family)
MKVLIVIGLFWSVASVVCAAEPPGNQDAALESFFREYLDASFQLEPLSATRLGDHRFDDRVDDLSKTARAAVIEHDRKTLAELGRRFPADRLTRAGQVDLDIFQRNLERNIWLAEHFDPFEDDPRTYVSYVTESVYLLLTQSSLEKSVNLKNAIARMGELPRLLEVGRARLKVAPRVKVETAIRQTEGAISFYADGLFKLAGMKPDNNDLSLKAERIVAALNQFLDFLKTDVLKRSNDEWRVGPDLFTRKLDLELDAGIGAKDVLDEAEREAARVESEMAVIARQMWGTAFPGKPLPLDDPSSRRAMIQQVLDYVANDHGTVESLLGDVRSTVGDIKSFISSQKILRLPEPDQCRIVEMPEFLRGNSVAYLNAAPPLDVRGSSEYAISPPPSDWTAHRAQSYLREYNRAMLKILTIHEAYPGHYVQLEYSNRCPSLIRRVLSSGTFAEGWAVYTEQMMLDQGFGRGDLGLRLQQLKFYLRTVVNAILDNKMQAGSMTDAQAMELLVGRAFQTEGEAVGKIIRSKQTACQLSTYFVGRTAFYRLRQQVQRAQGKDFDLARFHEATLSHGTIPVKYLPELVGKTLNLQVQGVGNVLEPNRLGF